MPKINPQVELLERENKILRKIIEESKKEPGDIPCAGCMDHSCVIKAPNGMGTNGGCTCNERNLRRVVMWYKRKVAFLEETIKQMISEK